VVTTLTFYHPNVSKDSQLLNLLLKRYEKVHLWIQGIEDYDYLQSLDVDKRDIVLIPPSVTAFNNLLDTHPNIEYAGTRLHAGIRAIQKGRRTMIVAVDNRAIEISRTTGLPVISRENVEQLLDFTDRPYVTNVVVPMAAINQWKESLVKFNASIGSK
jgi:hypothetical protein